MSEAFVSLRQLTLAYGENIAVPELDLDIEEGELITLLGPSGCGKTTTMRAIAGLLQPKSGSIEIDGKDVTRLSANKRQIGLVFQSYALFPHLSAFENVAFGLRLQNIGGKDLSQRVDQGLERVGLADFTNRKPSELSGGQQQRLALARSLVMEPKVLLLDEPLSNLDARLRLEMRTELQRLQRETGITMIFVTHDQSEALALADRIVLMNEGRIAQLGTPEQLYSFPDSIFAADFVGFENIVRVIEVKDNRCVIANRDTHHTGQLDINGRSNGPYLAWRPAAIQVGRGSHQGKVLGVAFAGETREYVLESAIGNIKAHASVDEPIHRVGDEVSFDLPLAAARELAE